jgi:hypothetical protein
MHQSTGGDLNFLIRNDSKFLRAKKRRTGKKIPPTNVADEQTQHIHNEASYILECDTALLG